jgi:DNA-binding transcriptional ArsR family regulator
MQRQFIEYPGTSFRPHVTPSAPRVRALERKAHRLRRPAPAAAKLDGIFGALADPTRRAMLRSLAAGQRNIGALAAPFRMSFAAASKHVRVLERAGLVRRRIEGRSHVCRLELAPLRMANQWLRFYELMWRERLDALATALDAGERAAAASKRKRGHAR